MTSTTTQSDALLRTENALRAAALVYARENRCEVMDDDALWEEMAAAVVALSAPVVGGEEMRQQVARIINPSAWDNADRYRTGRHSSFCPDTERAEATAKTVTATSLAKADAILKLLPPSSALEDRVKRLEADSHPPIDLTPAMDALLDERGYEPRKAQQVCPSCGGFGLSHGGACFECNGAGAVIVPPSSADDQETYEIGKRDGYEQAVQEIDEQTGGDGEYRFCTDGDPERHTPDPASMIKRIVERFNAPSSADCGAMPDDVERLVLAARHVAFIDQGPEAIRDLDAASEAFASRVPWEDQHLLDAEVEAPSPITKGDQSR